MNRRSLSQILTRDGQKRSSRQRGTTLSSANGAAAAGEYTARILSGELATARTSTALNTSSHLKSAKGEHVGRHFSHDV